MQIPENVGPTINLTLSLNPKDVSIGDSGNIPINKQMAANVGIKGEGILNQRYLFCCWRY